MDKESLRFERAAEILPAYFKDGVSVDELAQRLKLNPSTIYRVISEANHTEGVIVPRVDLAKFIDIEHMPVLEHELSESFPGLALAEVIEVPEEVSGLEFDYEMDSVLHCVLGKAAADLVSKQLRPGDTVGVGGGRSLTRLASTLSEKDPNSLKTVKEIVALSGGLPTSAYLEYQSYPSPSSDEIASTFAAITGKKVNYNEKLYPYFYTEDENLKKKLTSQNEDVDVAIFGLGSVHLQSQHDLLTNPLINNEDLINLVRSIESKDEDDRYIHPMVEIFNQIHIVNRGNHPEISDIDRELIAKLNKNRVGPDLDRLRSDVPVRIGIAGGLHKYNAVKYALDSGLLTHLVTDNKLAEMLIEKSS